MKCWCGDNLNEAEWSCSNYDTPGHATVFFDEIKGLFQAGVETDKGQCTGKDSVTVENAKHILNAIQRWLDAQT